MIKELTWDSEFFGRKIGKLTDVPAEETLLKKELNRASRQHFVYLTCRLGADEIMNVQRLQRHGFYMTDVGIVWEKRPAGLKKTRIPVREGTLSDAEMLRKIASGLFSDGRFYCDPFFTREEADRLYQAWAENSFKGAADKVFLVEGKGFITCKLADDVGVIPLVGVSGPHQGQGIGTALMQAAEKWFLKMKVKLMTVRTQAGNMNAVKLYRHNGFNLQRVNVTMAKIFFM